MDDQADVEASNQALRRIPGEMAPQDLREELRSITGRTFVFNVGPLREWLTPEQMKETRRGDQDLDQVVLSMMVLAARAAYEKGKQDERAAHNSAE